LEKFHFSVGSPAYILSTFPCGLNYTDKILICGLNYTDKILILNYTDKIVIVNAIGAQKLVKYISSILLLLCAQFNIFGNK